MSLHELELATPGKRVGVRSAAGFSCSGTGSGVGLDATADRSAAWRMASCSIVSWCRRRVHGFRHHEVPA